MARIKIDKKLDLSLPFPPSGEPKTVPFPSQAALELSSYDYLRLEPLVHIGDEVHQGQALARVDILSYVNEGEDVNCPSKIDIMGIFDRAAKKQAKEQLFLI